MPLVLFVLAVFVVQSTIATAEVSRTYALDEVSRIIPAQGNVPCPKLELIRHRGKAVSYHKPVLVYRGFQERLEKFEETVAAVATEVYGRPPRRIKHLGTYNCRRIRRYPNWLSGHALGNAIDIEGFDFGPAKGQKQRKGSPDRILRRAFRVRIEPHWGKERGIAAIHARFLRLLTDRLIEQGTFRGLLGPAFPGHKNHFHFDVGPFELIEL